MIPVLCSPTPKAYIHTSCTHLLITRRTHVESTRDAKQRLPNIYVPPECMLVAQPQQQRRGALNFMCGAPQTCLRYMTTHQTVLTDDKADLVHIDSGCAALFRRLLLQFLLLPVQQEVWWRWRHRVPCRRRSLWLQHRRAGHYFVRQLLYLHLRLQLLLRLHLLLMMAVQYCLIGRRPLSAQVDAPKQDADERQPAHH